MRNEEIWKSSIMYPDLEVSSQGRVRAIHCRKKIRLPVVLPYGPKMWVIRLNRVSRYIPIYALMNDAFQTDVYTPEYRPSLALDPPDDIKKYNTVGDGYIHVVGEPLFFKTHRECAEYFQISRQTISIALRDRGGWVPSRKVQLEVVNDDEDGEQI